VPNLGLLVRFFKFCISNQVWILGEANEVVASAHFFQRCREGPPFESFAPISALLCAKAY